MKLKPPKRIHRTTIYELVNNDDHPFGVYIVAYLGRIIYVGGTTQPITSRLSTHYYSGAKFGKWLISTINDWHNVRIDILEPESVENEEWITEAEKACIQKFRPLLNYQHKPKMTTELVFNTSNLSF